MHINYFQHLTKNKTGSTGIVIITFFLVTAIFAPFLTPYSPTTPSTEILFTPSAKHWLGTNDVGQDILTRVIYGARTSLIIAVLVGLITVFLAVAVGGMSALIGGLCERLVLRLIDILLIIPDMVVIILIAAYVRPSLGLLVVLLSVFSWQGSARIFRSQVLMLKQRSHIQAARTFGAGNMYLLIKHIVPDMGSIMTAAFVQHARRAVFMGAGLAFLGIADPTMVNWGGMLNKGLQFSYLNVWYWLLPPGIALSLTIMGFTFIGYALEEMLNPRLRVSKNC